MSSGAAVLAIGRAIDGRVDHTGFFAKAPWFADWPGPVLASWRAVFASVLLVPCVRRPTWSPGLIPMVLVFALMNATYLSAMAQAEASVAIWLQNTAPVWTIAGGLCIMAGLLYRHAGMRGVHGHGT